MILPEPALAQDLPDKFHAQQPMAGYLRLAHVAHELQQTALLQRRELGQARDAQGTHSRPCPSTLEALAGEDPLQQAHDEG